MSVQGGPLMASQSIDIPASGSMFLDNDLTNDGTITMDTSPSGDSYLYLEGYTFTNAGTFDIPADGNSGSYAQVVNGGSFVNSAGGSVVDNGLFNVSTYVQDGGTNWAPRCRRRRWF